MPRFTNLLLSLIAILLSAGHPTPLSAQDGGACLQPIPGDTTNLFVTPSGSLCRSMTSHRSGGSSPFQAVGQRETRPGTAFLLSLAVPGLGQRIQGHGRWTAYVAAELWAWIQYRSRRREGRNLQEEYRDLAWLVARRVSSGWRQEGDWEYYETLTKYSASGAYDSDPGTPGIQPEEDSATFNGSVWVLSQEIYLPEDPEAPLDESSPQYQQALDYYASRAYDPSMAWDWGGNPLHQAEYNNLIRSSDENLRRATAMIGVILANHLLSGIDALVSGRLGVEEAEGTLLDLALLPGPFTTHQLGIRVRLPTR